jgi:hypothetical protein
MPPDGIVFVLDDARGSSRYIVPRETEHVTTNLWLIEQFGARGRVERRQVVVDGLGVTRVHTPQGASVRQSTSIV